MGKPGVEIFHINDYPANFPKETIVDADRVYPGDGIAPIGQILKTIKNPEPVSYTHLDVYKRQFICFLISSLDSLLGGIILGVLAKQMAY